MQRLSRRLAADGWALRSGGADGADTAFEKGVLLPGQRAIYLPAATFNGRSSTRKVVNGQAVGGYYDSRILPGWDAASSAVQELHEAPQNLSPFAEQLMRRNVMQMLGPDLSKPASMVITSTPGGAIPESGGTRFALKLADAIDIPVRNLGDPKTRAEVEEYLGPAQESFRIVPSRGGAFDVLGQRANGRTMATVERPGQPGWLGNPFVAQDAGGPFTRLEATQLFGRLVQEKAQDESWRDAFLALRGKDVGYYKPGEQDIHLHMLQDWLQDNPG